MSGDLPHTTRDPQAKHLCPACGQPLQVLAKRHKVLGAWVPEWEVQPCANPECPRYEAPEAVLEAGAGPAPGGDAGPAAGPVGDAGPTAGPVGDAGPTAGPGPAVGDGTEATTTHVTGKNGETGRSPAPG
ncbi:hypothetical protein ACFY7C_22775 [Streptomyces sp. NPDC012769]|uniref:hypothetical protein n=1 Tax=Streptomyces sp. NPDC012769 TaxID=3364848 RepID=UPI003692137B